MYSIPAKEWPWGAYPGEKNSPGIKSCHSKYQYYDTIAIEELNALDVSIGNSGLSKRLCQSDLQRAGGGCPVQQMIYMHQLRIDQAEIIGTVAPAKEWIINTSMACL